MIPFPPMHLKKSVGPIDDGFYDNPNGDLVFEREIPVENYQTIFDFGCGCGRVARQLMLMKKAEVGKYVGIDLFKESIDWCSANLSARNDRYRFHHHDVYNRQFNPNNPNPMDRFPVDEKFMLVNAHSVFTHITEPHIDHYMGECSRVLGDNGIFRSTWFLFDKQVFPMMQEFQNCLYINLDDPTNATIYDYKFIQNKFAEHGLVIFKITPPKVKGFQWVLLAGRMSDGRPAADFPEDAAPVGVVRPPVSIA